MKESSRLPLFDLRKLNASLPVPSVPESSVRVLVVGARDDFIVVQFFRHITKSHIVSHISALGCLHYLFYVFVDILLLIIACRMPKDSKKQESSTESYQSA